MDHTTGFKQRKYIGTYLRDAGFHNIDLVDVLGVRGVAMVDAEALGEEPAIETVVDTQPAAAELLVLHFIVVVHQTHMYVYACMHACMRGCMYVCVYVCRFFVCMCDCMCAYMHACFYICLCVQRQWAYLYMYMILVWVHGCKQCLSCVCVCVV